MAMPVKGDVSGIVDAVKKARGKLPRVPPLFSDSSPSFSAFIIGTYGFEAQSEALDKVQESLSSSCGIEVKFRSFSHIVSPLYASDAIVQLKAFEILLSAVAGEYGKEIRVDARPILSGFLYHSSDEKVKRVCDSVIIPALADGCHEWSQVLRTHVLYMVNKGSGKPFLNALARHISDCGPHSEGLVAWFKQVDGKLTERGFRHVRATVLNEYVLWTGPLVRQGQKERTRMCTLLNAQLRARRSGGMTSFMQELVSQTRRAGVSTQRDLVARVARARATR